MKPFIFFISLLVGSCNSAPDNNIPTPDSTNQVINDTPMAQAPAPEKDTTKLGGTWFLQPVLISDTATGKIPRLIFDLATKRLTGNTGCNNMSGEFDYTDSTLQFNQRLITTKMACIGYNEKAFLESLLRTNSYKLQNGILILLFNQTELSRWTREVAPKPVVNKT